MPQRFFEQADLHMMHGVLCINSLRWHPWPSQKHGYAVTAQIAAQVAAH